MVIPISIVYKKLFHILFPYPSSRNFRIIWNWSYTIHVSIMEMNLRPIYTLKHVAPSCVEGKPLDTNKLSILLYCRWRHDARYQ